MAEFEVTATGATSPTFPQARELVVSIWGIYGDVPTGPKDPDGLMINIIAMVLDLAWQGTTQTWRDSFFRTALGTALDRTLDIFGQTREGPVKSTAELVLYGASLTNVPAGTTAETEASMFRFATNALEQIGDASTSPLWAARVLTAEVGVTYTLTIDGTPHDYLAVVGDDASKIAKGLEDAVDSGLDATAAVPGEDPQGRPVIVLSVTSLPGVVVASDDGSGSALDVFPAVEALTTALVTGELSAVAGSLNTIVTPIGGLVGVINASDATVGRDQESDADYRVRHIRDLFGRGGANDDGVAAKVRATRVGGVLAVLEASVVSNRTPAVVDGIDPHAYRTVFRLSPGVESAAGISAVGQTLWDAGPSGIEAFGALTIPVVDAGGAPQTVGATEAVTLYLHLKITVMPGEGFPQTGDPEATIKLAVANYFGPGGISELGIGDDFYRVQAVAPITLSVPGIQTIVILTDATPGPLDAPTFTAADIPISDLETLDVDSTRILVSAS